MHYSPGRKALVLLCLYPTQWLVSQLKQWWCCSYYQIGVTCINRCILLEAMPFRMHLLKAHLVILWHFGRFDPLYIYQFYIIVIFIGSSYWPDLVHPTFYFNMQWSITCQLDVHSSCSFIINDILISLLSICILAQQQPGIYSDYPVCPYISIKNTFESY